MAAGGHFVQKFQKKKVAYRSEMARTVHTIFFYTQFFIKLKDPRHSRAFWVNRALKQSILIIIIHIHSTLIQRSSCKNFIHINLANSAFSLFSNIHKI